MLLAPRVGVRRVEEAAHLRHELQPGVRLRPSLEGQVREALSATGLPPWCLALEITERVIVENPDAAARMLEELHEIGVQIHLDDFGTGYSSLSYLARFPIDCVKIDRSFVSRMQHHRADMEVVRAIAAIARNLDMEVVGEGIESPAEVASLISAGCHLGQGWLYSRALPPEEATRLVASQKDPPARAPQSPAPGA